MQDLISFLLARYRESPEGADSADAFAAFARSYLDEHPIVAQGYAERGLSLVFHDGVTVALTPVPDLPERKGTAAVPVTHGHGGPQMPSLRVASGAIPVTGG